MCHSLFRPNNFSSLKNLVVIHYNVVGELSWVLDVGSGSVFVVKAVLTLGGHAASCGVKWKIDVQPAEESMRSDDIRVGLGLIVELTAKFRKKVHVDGIYTNIKNRRWRRSAKLFCSWTAIKCSSFRFSWSDFKCSWICPIPVWMACRQSACWFWSFWGLEYWGSREKFEKLRVESKTIPWGHSIKVGGLSVGNRR